jgi:hypothetical protein
MNLYYKRNKFLVVAILLPFIAMLAWVGKLRFGDHDSKTFEVKIQGFDPRDLLSGYYLRYQLAPDSMCPLNANSSLPQCACFSENRVDIEPCETRTCKYYVPGYCQGNGFNGESLEKYYFPEDLKKPLLVVPQNATLRLKVGGGKARAEQIFVDGVKIEDWARQKISD